MTPNPISCMKSSVSLAWLFPLAICGFAAINVAYLDVAFTTVTRWVAPALLALFLLFRRDLFGLFRLNYWPTLVGWLIWNIATTFWSEQPLLSLAKSLAMASTVVIFIGGGTYWARSRPGSSLSYLLPLVGIALFAGLPGMVSLVRNSAGVQLYRGLALNPNDLGEYASISFIYVLYAIHDLWARNRGRLAIASWGLIAVALLALVWISGSRESLLCLVPVSLAFLVAVVSRRAVVLSSLGAAFVVGCVLLLPPNTTAPLSRPVMSFAMKGRSDLLFSRRHFWARSYRAAIAGGVAGLGFGVNAGKPVHFEPRLLTARASVRAKANSQLAMIEETGLIGFAAFMAVLIQMFPPLLAGIRRANGTRRMELLLLAGILVSLSIRSVFESWWTAPGSLDSVLFWATAGVAGGLVMLPQVRSSDI